MTTRYQRGNPRCGDVWRLPDGCHMLIDYVDPFHTGYTCDNGERASYAYTMGLENRLKGAVLVSAWEDLPFPWSDERGWTGHHKALKEDSLGFLFRVLDMKAKTA
jgi:hypothetical protein